MNTCFLQNLNFIFTLTKTGLAKTGAAKPFPLALKYQEALQPTNIPRCILITNSIYIFSENLAPWLWLKTYTQDTLLYSNS